MSKVKLGEATHTTRTKSVAMQARKGHAARAITLASLTNHRTGLASCPATPAIESRQERGEAFSVKCGARVCICCIPCSFDHTENSPLEEI